MRVRVSAYPPFYKVEPTGGKKMNYSKSLEIDLIRYNKYRKKCLNDGKQIVEIKELQNRLHSRYQKTSRIKKQLMYLLISYKYTYFCTFTFDDNIINKSDRTKRDLIKSCLYSYDSQIKFILNVDYGKKTDRQHYHAIVSTDSYIPLWLYLDLYYPCFKSCDYVYFDSKTDLSKLSKYIDKLSNHATKGSTKSSRVYSNFKSFWGDSITPTDRMELLNEFESLFLYGICDSYKPRS